jgi:hypothetical protein
MNAAARSSVEVPALRAILDRWGRRRRLMQATTWSLRGLIGGILTGAAAAGLGLAGGLLTRVGYLQTIFLAAWAGLLVGAFAAAVRPFPRPKAARFFDRGLDLQERLSTALELSRHDAGTPAQLVRRQLADSLRACEGVDVRRIPGPRISTGEAVLVAASIALALTPLIVARPLFEQAERERALKGAIREAIVRVEALRDDVAASPALDSEQRQEILAPLDKALEGLEQAEAPEQALAALAAAQADLRTAVDPQAEEAAQGLKQAGEALDGEPGNPLTAFGRELAEGDIDGAAEALENLANQSGSAAEAQQTARELAAAAEAMKPYSQAVSGRLAEAARAMASGDRTSAEGALSAAAETLREMGAQAHQADQAGRADAVLGESMNQVRQAAAGGESGDPAATAGEGMAAGSGAAGDQGESTGGSGIGQGGTSDSEGPAAGDGPISSNNRPGDDETQVYLPLGPAERLGAGEGEVIALPRSDQPGVTILGPADVPPGQDDLSHVPYRDVLGEFQRVAARAIQNLRPPEHLEALIREYFTSLGQ